MASPPWVGFALGANASQPSPAEASLDAHSLRTRTASGRAQPQGEHTLEASTPAEAASRARTPPVRSLRQEGRPLNGAKAVSGRPGPALSGRGAGVYDGRA